MMPTRELALTWRRQKQALLASYRAPRSHSYGGGYGGGLRGTRETTWQLVTRRLGELVGRGLADGVEAEAHLGSGVEVVST